MSAAGHSASIPAMTKLPIVLLCAPPGTGLTSIAGLIQQSEPSLIVKDLESKVCELHGSPSMEQVVRHPRAVLYKSWQTACSTIQDEIISAAQSADEKTPLLPAVLALHLTWFNPDTSEFFSPVDPFMLRRDDCEIKHVVILIDDVYDMFDRLRDPGDLYSDLNMQQHREMLKKLSPKMGKRGLQAQVIDIALGELLSWRRSEMIQAENLAHSLKAKLTVLGTKHDKQALLALITDPNTPRIYLSHRITEPRRHNNATRSDSMPSGEWLPIAHEVNTLHREFVSTYRDQAAPQVLITPTAIDELRFEPADKNGRRNPLLGSRWPLPRSVGRLLWSSPVADDKGTAAEHTQILVEHHDRRRKTPKSVHPVSEAIASTLANRVYFEIAFRDHVIVENTPRLCAYRPFFSLSARTPNTDADWSSGVEREIEHWEDAQRLHGDDIPPETVPDETEHRLIAFVHTKNEITNRFAWLMASQQRLRFLVQVRSHLEASWKALGVPERERNELLSNEIPVNTATQLGRSPGKTKAETIPLEIFKAIEPAVQSALHLVFSHLMRPGSDEDEDSPTSPVDRTQVALYAIEENSDGEAVRLDRLAQELRVFFSGAMDADAVEVHNAKFWSACEECFETTYGEDLSRYVAMELNVPYDEIREAAGEAGM